MLPELWGWQPNGARRFPQAHRNADNLRLTEMRMLEIDDVVVGAHLRVVGEIVDAVDDGEDEIPTGA